MTAQDPGGVAAALPSVEQPIRAAEVVGALSLATDLGTGQPLEHALRSAVLAVRLGELAGASGKELADTYYAALLHASGCTSNGHEATQLFGDDIAHRAAGGRRARTPSFDGGSLAARPARSASGRARRSLVLSEEPLARSSVSRPWCRVAGDTVSRESMMISRRVCPEDEEAAWPRTWF